MTSRPPRRRRPLLLVGALPWRALLLDFLVVVAWVAMASAAFRAAGWSRWLYYLVVFGGVLVYSLAGGRRIVDG